MRRFGYQNAVLSAIAVLLALGLIDRRAGGDFTSLPQAHAQSQPEQGGMTNALEQRKTIIAELRMLNSRLERVESKLNAGLSVKVTTMPPVQVNGGEAKAKPKAEKGDADAAEVRPAPGK